MYVKHKLSLGSLKVIGLKTVKDSVPLTSFDVAMGTSFNAKVQFANSKIFYRKNLKIFVQKAFLSKQNAEDRMFKPIQIS